MTRPPEPPYRHIHVARWRTVLISFTAVVGVLAYLVASVHNQNAHLDDRVRANLARSDRIGVAVDSVRVPVCAIMYASLSRPTTGFTPEQLASRRDYVAAYGPGTPEQPGLNCPKPLPAAASGD